MYYATSDSRDFDKFNNPNTLIIKNVTGGCTHASSSDSGSGGGGGTVDTSNLVSKLDANEQVLIGPLRAPQLSSTTAMFNVLDLNGPLIYYNGEYNGTVSMYSQVEEVVIDGTILLTPQSMINTTDARGTLVRAGNRTQKGDAFVLRAGGQFSNGGTDRNVRINFKLGTDTIASTLSFPLNNVRNTVGCGWDMEVNFITTEIGGTGVANLRVSGRFNYSSPGTNDTSYSFPFYHSNATNYETLSTKTYGVEFIWGESVASTSLIVEYLNITKLF